METVLNAAEALRQASANVYSANDPKFQDAIEQVSSIVRLLDLSSLSDKGFERLSLLLRRRLRPLYSSLPRLAFEYASTILSEISDDKIPKAKISDNSGKVFAWESVMMSLISGILDHLEAESTTEVRGLVGNALYPVIRPLYFTASNGSQTNPNALCLVFQLLSETVISHPENQRKLRNESLLGGKQIGRMLYQLKEFLAIEALLELFANLLPSTKSSSGRVKRSEFIKDTFDSSLFNCSDKIVHLLESVMTSDWSATAVQLMDTLAQSNNAYPQPFQASQLRVHDFKPRTIDRLYVDNSGFLASLDEDGKLETFQVPFTIIKMINISANGFNNTKIILTLASPPLIGQEPIPELLDKENISISCDIERKQDVEKLTACLRRRGLSVNTINQAARKLSKAEFQVELDFDHAGKDSQTTHDKMQNIARIWDSQDCTSTAQLTSPLVGKTLLPSPKPDQRHGPHISETKGLQAESSIPDKSEMHPFCTPEKANGNPGYRSERKAQTVEGSETRVNTQSTTKKRMRDDTEVAPTSDAAQSDPKSPDRDLHSSTSIQQLQAEAGKYKKKTKTDADALCAPKPLKPAMKTKNGCIQPRPKPSKRKGNTRKSKNPRQDANNENATVIPKVGFSRIPMKAAEIKPTRRSARVANAVRSTPKAETKLEPIHQAPPGCQFPEAPLNIDVTENEPESTEGISESFDQSVTLAYDPNDTSQYNDFLVPTKGGSFDLPSEELLTGDVRIIDLTQEDSPMHTSVNSSNHVNFATDILMDESPNSSSNLAAERASLSPILDHKKLSAVIVTPNKSFKSKAKLGTDSPSAVAQLKRISQDQQQSKIREDTRTICNEAAVQQSHIPSWTKKHDNTPLSRIVQIIGEINEIVIYNVSARFEHVEKEIQIGNRSILRETGQELKKMCAERFEHFEALVDLEERYAGHGRRIQDGIEDWEKAAQDVSHGLRIICQDHNRRSLSRKFPNSLFGKLPAMISRV